MKTFFRTNFGKTLLFILCVINAVAFAISVTVVGVSISEEYYKISLSSALKEIDRISFENMSEEAIANYISNPIMQVNDDCWNYVIGKEGEILQYSYSTLCNYDLNGERDFSVKYLPLKANVNYWDSYGRRISYEREEWVSRSSDIDYESGDYLIISGSVSPKLPAYSELNIVHLGIEIIYDLRYLAYPIMALSLIFGIIFFVMLLTVSGRKPGSEDIVPGPLNGVYYDLMFVFCALVMSGLCILSDSVANEFGDIAIIPICISVLVFICLGLGMSMSMAARIKQGTLLKNTLIYTVLHWLFKPLIKLHKYNVEILKNMGILWQVVLAVGIFSLLEIIGIGIFHYEADCIAICWFLSRVVILPIIVYFALSMRKLEKSGEALAKGNLSHQTDLKGLIGPLKHHGEDLNNIAKGMELAIDEKIKSERMKTELITNVSHDIKTPLTSIINYAGLISEQETDNEAIKEYSEVLVRQSARLKRLIEDLVEASKASTGTLEVELMPCDPSNFLTQAEGEYQEKFEAAGLTLITKGSDKEAKIMADGRRMWRIFDNLMNNICKYAQPGTRVYLTLEINDANAIFVFKNTSRDELNVSADELMERFVRGDESRNTEGNGLGLSIAKSLADLQKGKLTIAIDGDLFKAILTFPLVKD